MMMMKRNYDVNKEHYVFGKGTLRHMMIVLFACLYRACIVYAALNCIDGVLKSGTCLLQVSDGA